VDWLSVQHSGLTLKALLLEESVLDFRVVFTPIQQPTIIIHTGTTCDRITIILSRIRTVTEAPHTPGITGVAPIATPIATIIITAIN
jgi:hypothetical protein